MAVKASPTSDSASEIEAYFIRKELRLAAGWRPEPGSWFRGKVIALSMREDGEYGPYPIVVYRVITSGGPTKPEPGSVLSLHAFHTIIRERLAELETDMDMVQWVSYEGAKPSGKRKKPGTDEPQEYYLYDVENDGAATNIGGKDVNFKF
jgi:hypothetical protein